MKKPIFDTVKIVKGNARARVGQPAASFAIPNKKQKSLKKRLKKVDISTLDNENRPTHE